MASAATEYGIVNPKRPWYKKKRFIIPLAIVGMFFVIGLLTPPDPATEETEAAAVAASEDASPAEELAAQEEADRVAAEEAAAAEADAAEADAAEQAAAEEAARVEAERVAAEQAAAAAAEEAAQGTLSQQNAYESAKSYLDFAGFSRAGLLGQLTSQYGEQFPPEDAEFAIARLEAEGGVDWNAEAAESAKSYLEFSSFSRQGLIDQLTSEYGEQFTQEQAEYGVSQAGF